MIRRARDVGLPDREEIEADLANDPPIIDFQPLEPVMQAMQDEPGILMAQPDFNAPINYQPRRYISAYNALQSNPGTARGTPWSRSFFGANWAAANDFQRAMRRATRFRGDGAYFSKNPFMADAFRAGGSWLGERFMPGAGGAVGRELGARASKFLGFGAYDTPMSGNDLVTSLPGGGSQQQIGTVGDESGDLIVRNTEFIGNVTATWAGPGAGSSPFAVTTYQLNPGLVQTFPFLSQIAQNYELYDFVQLLFQYKPLSGEMNASSNSLGSIIMCTNYDPDGAQFLNKIQMENYSYANSTKPSCGAIHGVECKPGSGVTDMKYTRAGTSSRDKIFTDPGSFQIATEGIPFSAPGSSILGELWVTYTVKLSRPNLFSSILGNGILQDMFTAQGAAGTSLLTNVQNNPTNLIGGTIGGIAPGFFWYTFPSWVVAGTYMIYARLSATPPTGQQDTFISTPLQLNMTVLESVIAPNDIPILVPNNNNNTSLYCVVKITGSGAAIQFALTNVFTPPVKFELMVMQVNSAANYSL